jgi:isoleucyl-tRNA synthetase
MAPGHGLEDFEVCKKHKLPVVSPVCDFGRFTASALPRNPRLLEGIPVGKAGSAAVLEYLGSLKGSAPNVSDVVFLHHDYTHTYPVDWRTKQPVFVRATDQWFADVGSVRDRAVDALESVRFIPESGKSRLTSFVNSRSHWCISRQRAWGMPIPALYRIDTSPHEAVMNSETIEHIINVIKDRGTDAWWADPEDDPAWIPSHLEGKYVRGKDTMDVWFDSGTSWTLLDDSKTPPADVYLEGTDQHRGWFQSSLLTFAATSTQALKPAQPSAPFKTLITHGFILDHEGRKMSKSIGNVIAPDKITSGEIFGPAPNKARKPKSEQQQPGDKFDAMGPDLLRLWAASVDYTKDVHVGAATLGNAKRSLAKLRMTLKWLVGALSDADVKSLTTAESSDLMDRIIVDQLSRLSRAVFTHYQNHEFHRATVAIDAFVNHRLSAVYFEAVKDRLYTGSRRDRAAAHGVLHAILNEMLAMLAPVTPLMVEEAWAHAPPRVRAAAAGVGPLRRPWAPHAQAGAPGSEARDLDGLCARVVELRRAVAKLQEPRRAAGRMGGGLQCAVRLARPAGGPARVDALDRRLLADPEGLAAALVVSRVDVVPLEDGTVADMRERYEGVEVLCGEDGAVRMAVAVSEPEGAKCARCWRYLDLGPLDLCGRCEEVVREEHPERLGPSEPGVEKAS